MVLLKAIHKTDEDGNLEYELKSYKGAGEIFTREGWSDNRPMTVEAYTKEVRSTGLLDTVVKICNYVIE
jgi:hypothetical protein